MEIIMDFKELLDSRLHFSDSRRFRQVSLSGDLNYYACSKAPELIYPNADCEVTLDLPMQATFSDLPGYLFLYLYNASLTVESADDEGIEASPLPCHAGQALLLSLDRAWRLTIPSHGTHFYLCFFDGGCSRLIAGELCPSGCRVIAVPSASGVTDSIRYLLDHPFSGEIGSQILFSKKFTDLLTELYLACTQPSPGRDKIPSYVRRTKELFDTQYQENYTLDKLETLFGKSKYSICREFGAHYGISPLQYLNRRRIEEAKRLLLSTDLPVHEIASHVGIENTNHFIQLFKKNTGATPFVFKQEAPVSICELRYPCTPDDRPQ